jgi:hypothetical protein
MAITILQQPLDYTPVYNDINFVCSSTNVAQPNFNFIFDVKINGTIVSRHRIPARPDNNYGLFNAKRIAENYLTQNFPYNLITVNVSSSLILLLVVEVGEEYGATPTIYPTLSTSGNKYLWIASLDAPEWVDYTITKYRLMTSQLAISQLLTNNANHKIKLTEKAYLSALVGETNAVGNFQVRAYDSSDNLIKNTYITNPYATITSTNTRLVNVPSGPSNLNQIINANLDASTQHQGDIIPSNSAWYEITTRGTSASSLPVVYTINTTCTKYDSKRIYFLNKLGAYDAFTFDLVSRENNAIERKQYRRNLGGFSGSSYIYSDLQRSNIIYDTQVKETMVLNSNWITELESAWLEELLTSPITYMETTEGIEVVNVTDSNYEVRKTVNDKLFNLQITIEKSYLKTRQRG